MTTENLNLATIEVIEDIFPHPDPEVERLEIAKVLNFTCVVGKGAFKKGDLCILIQPDSVLPDAEWTEPYKKFCKTRVRSVKIRNFISFGIVEKFKVWEELTSYKVGTDITNLLGITKYETIVGNEAGSKGGLPFNIPKTDETLCLHELTEIITKAGVKTIRDLCENLKPNEEVASFNELTNELEFQEVLEFNISNNNNDWYKVTTESGKTLVLTSNHPVYLPQLKCYREVKDLKENDIVLTI